MFKTFNLIHHDFKYVDRRESMAARCYIFKPKTPIWVNFGGSKNENVAMIYGHLVYFTAIWSILRPFGLFYGHLVYFTAIWYILCSFWYVAQRKIWQPCGRVLIRFPISK
jgi:hypothetical protein